MTEVATSSYKQFRPEMGIPVMITLGRTPGWFTHEHEEVRLLAPPPHVFALRDEEEFEAAYRQHLDLEGVDRIVARGCAGSTRPEGGVGLSSCASRTSWRGSAATAGLSQTGGTDAWGKGYRNWTRRTSGRSRGCSSEGS